MPQTKTFKIGDREFTVGPFTLEQLVTVGPILGTANVFSKEGLQAARDAIVAATGTQVADLAQIQTDLNELDQAVSAIAEASGMLPLLERRKAEAEARAASQPTN